MNFDPVDRDLNQWMKEQEPKPWSGKARITLYGIHEDEKKDTVIECEFKLPDADDEDDVIEQIRDIIEHQISIQIL